MKAEISTSQVDDRGLPVGSALLWHVSKDTAKNLIFWGIWGGAVIALTEQVWWLGVAGFAIYALVVVVDAVQALITAALIPVLLLSTELSPFQRLAEAAAHVVHLAGAGVLCYVGWIGLLGLWA